jgi:hypothetical protein
MSSLCDYTVKHEYLQCREVSHDIINNAVPAEITELKFLLEEKY